MNIKKVRTDLAPIWNDYVFEKLNGSKLKIDVSHLEEVTDDEIQIDEVFLEEDLNEVADQFRDQIKEYAVFPFIEVMGGHVVCIGISRKNRGEIFYLDFDFGLFKLANNINEFIDSILGDKS